MGQPNCKESGLVNDERIIQRLPFSMLVHYQRNCMCTNPEACFHHCTGEDKCRGAIELCRFCKGTIEEEWVEELRGMLQPATLWPMGRKETIEEKAVQWVKEVELYIDAPFAAKKHSISVLQRLIQGESELVHLSPGDMETPTYEYAKHRLEEAIERLKTYICIPNKSCQFRQETGGCDCPRP